MNAGTLSCALLGAVLASLGQVSFKWGAAGRLALATLDRVDWRPYPGTAYHGRTARGLSEARSAAVPGAAALTAGGLAQVAWLAWRSSGARRALVAR